MVEGLYKRFRSIANLGKNFYSEIKVDEYNKINSIFGVFTEAIKYKDNYIIVNLDSDNIKNSSLHVIDEKFNELMKFRIGGN